MDRWPAQQWDLSYFQSEPHIASHRIELMQHCAFDVCQATLDVAAAVSVRHGLDVPECEL